MSSGIALQRNNECVQRMTNSAPANEQQLAAVLRNHRTTKTSLPSDFLQLQSLRSSATGTKFAGCGAADLYETLLAKGNTDKTLMNTNKTNSPLDTPSKTTIDDICAKTDALKLDKYKAEQRDSGAFVEDEQSSCSSNDGELIERGPIRHVVHRQQQNNAAPYHYGSGDACHNDWSPQTTVTSNGSPTEHNASALEWPAYNRPAFVDSSAPITQIDLNQLHTDDSKELPDALSDFILKYSRRYSVTSGNEACVPKQGSTSSVEGSPTSTDSPRSACCSAPLDSPSAPVNRAPTPATPPKRRAQAAALPPYTSGRDRIRALLTDAERDEAWLWMCKCTRSCPGAIYYSDPDGDSLLHIVVWHKDIAKMYALVEQMLKQDNPNCRKPWDMPNRMYETPLFLAIQKRCVDAVWYMLEVGANPNAVTRRPERDGPLHYAAARGMTEIVEALCAHTSTNVDLMNGMGMTALLCAVRNHGVIEEDSQCLINNKPVIRVLLKSGAQANIADATNGKTVLHYIVERMDPDLVDIFRASVPEPSMLALAMQTDFNGDTPLVELQRMIIEAANRSTAASCCGDEELRKKMFITLVAAGGAGLVDTPRVSPVSEASPAMYN